MSYKVSIPKGQTFWVEDVGWRAPTAICKNADEVKQAMDLKIFDPNLPYDSIQLRVKPWLTTGSWVWTGTKWA